MKTKKCLGSDVIVIQVFLEQVHHGLWDSCSFVINSVHVLQAGPYQYHSNGIENVLQSFKDR